MKEKLFALKKGTEVAVRFDGVTIPYTVPSTPEEVLAAAGSPENMVAVFNQAHALNIQKYVKAAALDDKSTVETLRERAASFKYGQVRERSGNGTGGATKVRKETVEKVLGGDLLASFTPEQRAMYEKQLAALRPQTDAATANGAATAGTTPPAAPSTPAPAATGKKNK